MFFSPRKMAAAAAVAVAVTVAVPAGNAFAIDFVQCNNNEFVHLTYVPQAGLSGGACYANKGRTAIHRDVTKIHTGNNKIRYYDQNGSTVEYGKWLDVTFPHVKHVKMADLEIL